MTPSFGLRERAYTFIPSGSRMPEAHGAPAQGAQEAPAERKPPSARVAYDLGEVAHAGAAVLFAGYGLSLKAAVRAARKDGFSLFVTATEDKRRAFALGGAAEPVCIGPRFDEKLFSNAYAVLGAARDVNAAAVLLCSDDLAADAAFLAGARQAGIRVFARLTDDQTQRFWIECEAPEGAPVADEAAWRRCPSCKLMHDAASIAAAGTHCPSCGALYRLDSDERIAMTFDEGTFEEWDADLPEADPLGFPGYPDALERQRERTGRAEAVRCGRAELAGIPVSTCVMESAFMMGSMGSVVGEKVTRAVERASAEELPLIVFTASGGARMQEGLASLMQMAKVSAAVGRHADAGLLYVSVVTDPTTGGVTASFAMQGDVVIAEPGALIGFAGRRVIQDTIRETLPDDFQTAEFALAHGLIDAVVPRERLRPYLAHLVAMHVAKRLEPEGGVVYTHASVEERLLSGTPYSTVSIAPKALEDARAWEREHPVAQAGRRERKQAMAHADAQLEVDSSLSGVFGGGHAARRSGPSDDGRAWKSVQTVRNARRPSASAYIGEIVEGFCELHGDRASLDDGAIVAGIGWLGHRPVTVLAEERGRDLADRVRRNFGCPRPEGYRKTLRLMRQAEKFGRPVVCIVDTQGAFCGAEAEERGIGNAIADNLRELAGLRVPVVSVLVGEGGSGGALALAVANRVGMLEHAVYSVLSPEGFASILWKDRARAAEAAGVMKMDAASVRALGVVDEVIPEGPRPAHENPAVAAENVRAFLMRALDDLDGMTGEELAAERYERFRRF